MQVYYGLLQGKNSILHIPASIEDLIPGTDIKLTGKLITVSLSNMGGKNFPAGDKYF
jgi:hypothetical protein